MNGPARKLRVIQRAHGHLRSLDARRFQHVRPAGVAVENREATPPRLGHELGVEVERDVADESGVQQQTKCLPDPPEPRDHNVFVHLAGVRHQGIVRLVRRPLETAEHLPARGQEKGCDRHAETHDQHRELCGVG